MVNYRAWAEKQPKDYTPVHTNKLPSSLLSDTHLWIAAPHLRISNGKIFLPRAHTFFFYIMCWRPLQLYVCFLIFLLINMMAAHLLYFVTYIYTRKRDTPQGRRREKNVCQGERGKKKRSVGGTPLLFNFFFAQRWAFRRIIIIFMVLKRAIRCTWLCCDDNDTVRTHLLGRKEG